MLVPFFILGHFILILNALVGSIGQRFTPGIAGGLVRATLTIVSAISWLKIGWFPGRDGPTAIFATLQVLAFILGPLVSFAVLFIAYRRARDIPAAQEQQAERLVNAWLAVGIPDALHVVMTLFAYLYASDPS